VSHSVELRLRAKKSLGQNFLVDKRAVSKIIESVAPRPGETIVEIGPGGGALTTELLASGARILCIELDRDLIPILSQKFSAQENFTLVESDALEVDFLELIKPAQTARVVANLPYYISTAILQKLIDFRDAISESTLMLQREVVERITAPPGTSDRGFLSVIVQAFCEITPLFDLSPTSFRPAPKVWSTVARFRSLPEPVIRPEKYELFRQLVSTAFMQKRKTLTNNLKAAPVELGARIESAGGPSHLLSRSEIDPAARAESLDLRAWQRLLEQLC
jgi:16S rRNA (adenine1518-N6/adenine1519-N6)-dimethyltransferase